MDDTTELPAMEPLAHVANLDMPCFACFLNDLVFALNDVYAEASPAVYDDAMATALQQVADGMARLFLAACEDADAQRAAFNERITTQMLLLAMPAGSATAH